ncbi:hypothetical protein OEZ85_009739 [Tetradesmus obliquus]|nr:hypothetical protein OEZ85_009739 [Tetradesmus obliquus]
MQLAEAVALLARHQYDDAWGLWLISKEAADRLAEFEPCDMVLLLEAVAGMCVADDALCRGVAEAVAAKRGAYSAAQLAEVGSALQRMGYAGEV